MDNIHATTQDLFDHYDRDKNGTINVSELRAVFQDMNRDVSDEEINGVISEMDLEKDGELNIDEFVELLSIL
ncbi:hypothetical protein BGW38_008880 [Lunasporangiospora selenospora]|uniref:EF-hand domain-containing protein n=1 Tax=Lunasporangiospora selenospora TaxID=979761 RepID=A0A9P6KG47_9FUNG|nr:hypothetical protein BGW38_008880 [Lunasporangiospora selenospora]